MGAPCMAARRPTRVGKAAFFQKHVQVHVVEGEERDIDIGSNRRDLGKVAANESRRHSSPQERRLMNEKTKNTAMHGKPRIP